MTSITDPNRPKSERILDAAEALFAAHGYDGVTMRQIAQQAGVDVALASYHFGKKLDVFEAAFLRRAQIMNDLRHKALAQVKQEQGEQLNIEHIIAALLKPVQQLQLNSDEGWQHYCALVAYINSSATWGKELMHNHFDDLIKEFIEALQQALPEATAEQLHWCYQYLSGAMTLTMANTGRIDRLSAGQCRSDDFATAYDLMIPFFVAGFQAICDGGKA